ncbi:hypothetical protein [Flavobacterium aquiphilum]|uniref:hypothetical protein n=1 Tax=Flavobacterium aquiphilum TaxID=3003261 RepID=UPI0024806764|nr:hypothetical protein [Flavobacterium aquiphilum]
MTSLIDTLKKYKQSVDLENRFDYNFDIDTNIFSDQEKNELFKNENIFSRNIRLKELIKTKTKGSYKLTDLNFWIINKWGGIQTFKQNENNLKKIETFSNQLAKSKLTKDTFSTISSLSKVSSFIEPDNYVIYDSRVIYAINWLIMTTKPTGLKYFPMPTGRNKKLVDFDINTIIHLTHLESYQNGEEIFYKHSVAYFEFCELIKTLSKTVFDDQTIKPYYLEMLLFTIADNEIFRELIKRTTVEIKLN